MWELTGIIFNINSIGKHSFNDRFAGYVKILIFAQPQAIYLK